MANEVIRQKFGNQLLFADHATDFGAAPATAANSLIIGTPTDVQLDLGGVVAGAGRQSTKTASLWSGTGSDEAPPYYRVDACLEFATAPTDGEFVLFYWGASPASGATGQPAGLGASDAAFTDTDGLLGQLQYIGFLSCRANVLNIGHVGFFQPDFEYGTLVVVNETGANLAATADETHVVMTPFSYGPTE